MYDIQYLYNAIKKNGALRSALFVAYEKLQNAKDSNARAYAEGIAVGASIVSDVFEDTITPKSILYKCLRDPDFANDLFHM